MTTSAIRSRALMAAVLGMSAGMGQSASVIERPHPRWPDDGPPVPRVRRRKTRGRRSNEPVRQSARALKKRRAKIARASRRYLLREV